MNKILVVGIILTFICVGFQPVISIEINNSNEIINDDDCFECNLEEQLNEIEINQYLIRIKLIVSYISRVNSNNAEIVNECNKILEVLNNPDLEQICEYLINSYAEMANAFTMSGQVFLVLLLNMVFAPIFILCVAYNIP